MTQRLYEITEGNDDELDEALDHVRFERMSVQMTRSHCARIPMQNRCVNFGVESS